MVEISFHFDHLVDNNSDLVLENILGLVITTYVFYALIALLARLVFPVKRLAWCIGLINALIMSIIGVYFLIDIFPKIGMEYFTCLDGQTSVFHGRDNLGVFTCVIFAVGNIADLTLGLLFYPSELGLLTTYIHHTLYTWLMIFGMTTNGGFVQTAGPFTTAFMFCTIEELPTFILALGSVFPSARSDFGFGATFFVLRILFHITILHHEVKCNGYVPMYCLITLTLLLHLYWFYGWVTKYFFKSKKPKDGLSSKNK